MLDTETLQKLRLNAFENVNNGFFIADENGIFVDMNQAYADIYGYCKDEMIGHHMSMVVDETHREAEDAEYKKRMLGTGHASVFTAKRIRKDKSAIYTSSRCCPFIYCGAKYMVYTVSDITDAKAQDEKQKAQERILVQQSKMAAMGEMISAIAHQWRQPLNAIAIMVQDVSVAQKFGELDNTYIDDFTQKTMAQINFMSKTIDDFRNFFRPDKQKERFTLIGAVLDVVSLIQAQLKDANITVDVFSPLDVEECEPGEIAIYGYPNEFKQVVLNLLSNAKDAIIEKAQDNRGYTGEIMVSAGIRIHPEKRDVYLRICDNGCGVTEGTEHKIFDPYFTTKEQGKGTGVGLYMSKMIIEQNMKGTLAMIPREMGTCFEMVFAFHDDMQQ